MGSSNLEKSDADRRFYIVPIAGGLVYNHDGKPWLGEDTALACRHAVLAAHNAVHQGRKPVIFLSATKAPRYGDVIMGELMRSYVKGLVNGDSRIQVEFHEARCFNTAGECAALADFLCQQGYSSHDKPVTYDIEVDVKDWHARRTHKTMQLVMEKWPFNVTIIMRPHHDEASFRMRTLEFVKLKLVQFTVDGVTDLYTRRECFA